MKQKLLPSVEETIDISNSDAEGSCRIHQIQALQLQPMRVALGLILSILTASIFALACSWSKKLTRRFFFKTTPIDYATHFGIVNEDSTIGISVRQNLNGKITFTNKKLKYCYNEQLQSFRALEFDLTSLNKLQIHQLACNGIQDPILNQQTYGPCMIEVPLPTILSFMVKELTTPFYILQYISSCLWIAENYAILAIVMTSISLLITVINYFLLMNSVRKLRKMAENPHLVKVLRQLPESQAHTEVHSKFLVPGDIIAIEAKMVFPCDCILIQGEVLINEASLTGESIPVPKFALERNAEQSFSFTEDKRNCLFEGTKALSVKQQQVLAMVVRTGFVSFKGQVFRSVLYPAPQPFHFYRNAMRFMAILAIWILALYFAIIHRMLDLEFDSLIILFRFGDAITWIIPPAMPIFISMCQTYSLVRLGFKGILAIDPQKSLIAGEVNTVCFDKTGTLTTISIDVYGYQIMQTMSNEVKFLEPPFIFNGQAIDKTTLLFKLFGSCHCVSIVDGEIMGDCIIVLLQYIYIKAIDVEVFKFSGYSFEYSMDRNVKFRVGQAEIHIDILKVFEFESQLQRMSVLVKIDKQYYVFCKGSPEKIIELSLSSSIPHNLKTSLDALTMRGLRVLGLGIRSLSKETATELLESNRQSVECDLEFQGLLIMENKLKPDTGAVIRTLQASGIDLKVISGDNGLTTVQCARECNIIDEHEAILLVDYNEQREQLTLEQIEPQLGCSTDDLSQNYSEPSISEQSAAPQKLSHSEVLKELMMHLIRSENTIKKEHLSKSLVAGGVNGECNLPAFAQRHGFAITGKAFDYFWAQQPINLYGKSTNTFAGFADPLKQVSHLEMDDSEVDRMVFVSIVKKAKVFSRMRPEQKAQVIEQLQAIGRTVAMIGDGANDCAAIKQANIGISFAQSDASYSAPYSSNDQSISCVVKVLLDGRAALTNTIEVFQYYIYASVVKYIACQLMCIEGQNFSTTQLLWINYVATIPYLKAISLSGPSGLLSHIVPQDDMSSLPNQITIYFHLLTSSIGLILNYLYWRQSPYSEAARIENGNYIQVGNCQTTLFICLQLYCTTTVTCMYISYPFKTKIYRHKILMPLLVMLFSINAYMFFGYSAFQEAFNMMNLTKEPDYLRNQFLISIGVCLITFILHELLIKKKFPCTKPVMNNKKFKNYKTNKVAER